jgi:hypothetical protein
MREGRFTHNLGLFYGGHLFSFFRVKRNDDPVEKLSLPRLAFFGVDCFNPELMVS